MEQGHYKPMLLTKAKSLPEGDKWVYEPKLDGYRMLAYQSMARTALMTRHGNNFTSEFPQVAQQLPEATGGHAVVLDGEMTGFDEHGNHNVFMVRQRGARIVYFVFDILEINGEPIVKESWETRREALEEVIEPQPNIQLCRYFSDRDALLMAALEFRLEGIVAKKRGSHYYPGQRTNDWTKLKFPRY